MIYVSSSNYSTSLDETAQEALDLLIPPARERLRQSRLWNYLTQKRGLKENTASHFCLDTGPIVRNFNISVPPSWKEKGEWLIYPVGQPGKWQYGIAHLPGLKPKYYFPEDLSKPLLGLENLYHESCLVVEGLFDYLSLIQESFPAVCPLGDHLSEEQARELSHSPSPILMLDGDKAGREAAEREAEKLSIKVRIARLPEGEDPNSLLVKLGDRFRAEVEAIVAGARTLSDLRREEMACRGARFKPLYSEDLAKMLGLTIKKDQTNKVVTFLGQLSAYSDDSQINESFNAPSATGKTYIPLEISALFPPEDVIVMGYCSPTAFFHDIGVFDKEKGGYIVDLSRKVLIFLDQPHTLLLQHLRPLLSHDKKEIRLKITDKSQKAGLRTKNIYLRGYPAVIFCTAGLKIDEQEATRFLLLSPEISQEKIREAIYLRIKKETDPKAYSDWLEGDPERKLLKERILAIKEAQIKDIKIGCPERIEEEFFGKNKALKPRHARDIARILSLIKCFALLNWWHRDRDGSTVVANEDDVKEAFKIWDEIAESQELNLPPYIYNFYKDIILAAWKEEKAGLSRGEILKKHFEVYSRVLPDWQLRQEILPMLETAGLISQEPDPADKRKILVYPTTPLTISQSKNYSESHGGVKSEKAPVEKLFEETGDGGDLTEVVV
ncbi:hypothetical protein HKBW3S06_00508 [Candidatus Hakubella thermalkaliphila]|uniref:Toprim domain-containing protein n=1 Tax=Candidatus Hakubella thermalkaliphila TaxID=2754717 RepID=A0A6V8NLV6_9ACTN|nr:hypothetical protein HKBW3S06_00508 [Candidatus Hakubella thermalkaliphila]